MTLWDGLIYLGLRFSGAVFGLLLTAWLWWRQWQKYPPKYK